jgi:hypothetical protein
MPANTFMLRFTTSQNSHDKVQHHPEHSCCRLTPARTFMLKFIISTTDHRARFVISRMLQVPSFMIKPSAPARTPSCRLYENISGKAPLGADAVVGE